MPYRTVTMMTSSSQVFFLHKKSLTPTNLFELLSRELRFRSKVQVIYLTVVPPPRFSHEKSDNLSLIMLFWKGVQHWWVSILR